MGNTTTRDINDFIFDLSDFDIPQPLCLIDKENLTPDLWNNNLIDIGTHET